MEEIGDSCTTSATSTKLEESKRSIDDKTLHEEPHSKRVRLTDDSSGFLVAVEEAITQKVAPGTPVFIDKSEQEARSIPPETTHETASCVDDFLIQTEDILPSALRECLQQTSPLHTTATASSTEPRDSILSAVVESPAETNDAYTGVELEPAKIELDSQEMAQSETDPSIISQEVSMTTESNRTESSELIGDTRLLGGNSRGTPLQDIDSEGLDKEGIEVTMSSEMQSNESSGTKSQKCSVSESHFEPCTVEKDPTSPIWISEKGDESSTSSDSVQILYHDPSDVDRSVCEISRENEQNSNIILPVESVGTPCTTDISTDTSVNVEPERTDSYLSEKACTEEDHKRGSDISESNGQKGISKTVLPLTITRDDDPQGSSELIAEFDILQNSEFQSDNAVQMQVHAGLEGNAESDTSGSDAFGDDLLGLVDRDDIPGIDSKKLEAIEESVIPFTKEGDTITLEGNKALAEETKTFEIFDDVEPLCVKQIIADRYESEPASVASSFTSTEKDDLCDIKLQVDDNEDRALGKSVEELPSEEHLYCSETRASGIEKLPANESEVMPRTRCALITEIITAPVSGESDGSPEEMSYSTTPAGSCAVSAVQSPLSKTDSVVTFDEGNQMEQGMESGSMFDDNSLGSKGDDDHFSKDSKYLLSGVMKEQSQCQQVDKINLALLDEETRMDASVCADFSGVSSPMGDNFPIPPDEDSQGSTGTSSKREVRRFRSEVIVPESTEMFTAVKVVEYMWPLDGTGEHYFVQEHISQYLGIMSFKRRYPDLRRRPIDMQEKDYLKEQGLVSEIACDLGLTAIRSEDVLDVMFNDFPAKYEELQRVLRERRENQLKEKGKVEYQTVHLDKSKIKEYSRKAAEDAAQWNVSFNKERREERKYHFDLQTFTLQKPIWLPKLEKLHLGYYPVAVLPGQYTDYYKEYLSTELKCYPLNTVMFGPFSAEELAAQEAAAKRAIQEECSPCKENAEERLDDVKNELPPQPVEPNIKVPSCKVCHGTSSQNKNGHPEPLIRCGNCRSASHPTCIDLTISMVNKIEAYNWQCMDCKTCAQCNDPDDEENMIFCDMCDRGYHIYCVGLRRVPQGRWHCKECALCSSCGSRNPAGTEHIKNAEWQHEYKKDKNNKQLKYATTLCMPCDKYWKRRQFCPVCLKVYRSIPDDGMVRCACCPKYVHKDGCSSLLDGERYCNNCYKTRSSTALNQSRIIAAAKKKMASGF